MCVVPLQLQIQRAVAELPPWTAVLRALLQIFNSSKFHYSAILYSTFYGVPFETALQMIIPTGGSHPAVHKNKFPANLQASAPESALHPNQFVPQPKSILHYSSKKRSPVQVLHPTLQRQHLPLEGSRGVICPHVAC